MNHPTDLTMLSAPFRALIGNEGLNYQLLDLLPIPIEIFASDGMCIFYNRACLELNGVADANDVVGKYNLKNDPVCLGILGQETMDRIFRGEAVPIPDFPVPIQDAVDRGVIAERQYEAATMDIFCLPIWDGDVFVCTITFYTVKNMYQGRADIIRAQKYIDEHWLDEFDIDTVARAANLSKRHFQRIFKEITESTPFEYYQEVKIEKIKEKLLDGNLSIEQAFTACGVDYRGKTYLNLFKEKVGMTPAEYRKKNNIQ